MNSRQEAIYAMVAIPPPVNGQSVVSLFVLDALGRDEERLLRVFDIGPGTAVRNIFYHLTRIRRVLGAARALLRMKDDNVAFYTVLESGFGRIYNVFLLWLARRRGARIYLHHHTAAHVLSHDHSFAAIVRITGQRTTHIVLSNDMRSVLSARYPQIGRIRVLHNSQAVQTPNIQARRDAALPRIRLGFLSNLTIEKGIDLAIASLKATQRQNLDATLTIAGPALTKEARDAIATAMVTFGNSLRVLGPVAGGDKDAFFAGIDLFLFPSRYRFEAQPLVVLEAMAWGCVPVVSQAGFTAELVGDGLPRVADLDDFPEATASLCHSLIRDPSKLSRMSESARERYVHLKESAPITEISRLFDTKEEQAPAPLRRSPASNQTVLGDIADRHKSHDRGSGAGRR
jgi:glycosyltransferase involved in cell wall biosynthesis